ncbi:F0F1 ATP synthase subunit beta, partial [Candidatus Roizmanbacteria bacterium]|nr:F0F1 ATP synthase subunit beta [Candidatus Roizmanbacteria bacterium]
MKSKGKILSVKGDIVEVKFEADLPAIHHILVFEDDPEVKMEVYSSSSASTFYCISLTSSKKLYRGAVVVNTGNPIKIPVGPEILGRVIDLFGRAQDGIGELRASDSRT